MLHFKISEGVHAPDQGQNGGAEALLLSGVPKGEPLQQAGQGPGGIAGRAEEQLIRRDMQGSGQDGQGLQGHLPGAPLNMTQKGE